MAFCSWFKGFLASNLSPATTWLISNYSIFHCKIRNLKGNQSNPRSHEKFYRIFHFSIPGSFGIILFLFTRRMNIKYALCLLLFFIMIGSCSAGSRSSRGSRATRPVRRIYRTSDNGTVEVIDSGASSLCSSHTLEQILFMSTITLFGIIYQL